MAHEIDLSFLDDPHILNQLFPLAYGFYRPPSPTIAGLEPAECFEVEPGIRLGYRLWVREQENPCILYFHGNGETVQDYEWVAPLYLENDLSLCVVDYRGYGGSSGKPTFTNTLSDARGIFAGFMEVVEREELGPAVFVMGRSIGSIPACEVAVTYQDHIQGLIIESGAANNFRYRWSNFRPERDDVLGEDGAFLNKVKLRAFTKPTLIIHGLRDRLIPYSEADELFANAAAEDKQLVSIAAGHDDIMEADMDTYFGAIVEFVERVLTDYMIGE